MEKKRKVNPHAKGSEKYYEFFAGEPPTPKYWKHFKDGLSLFDMGRKWVNWPRVEKYDVDSKTFHDVAQLVKKTWVSQVTGQGKDARNLIHSKLLVKKVERIENYELYDKYARKRREFFSRRAKGRKVVPIENISQGDSKPVMTSKISQRMLSDVYPDINEFYLFHGTKKEYQNNITKKGFDARYGSASAMFGAGVYAAESSSKADQYTGNAS